jgi:superfamily II DNA or RNA helicase
MKARDYQADAEAAVFREWGSFISTLVVMPTGTGKTILFALVIAKLLKENGGKKVLVVAHREELIWQARNKIEKVTGLQVGIEMGELYTSPNLFGECDVIVSTVQTQNSSAGDRKRMGKFNPKDFSALIIDEAHHSTASSYQNLINYYKQNNPDIKILGVTATPDRADEEALGKVFDSVAYVYEILDAIHDGWLVPIDQQFVGINGLDFSEMRTTAGDLNGADLAAVMENEKNMQGVAGATIDIIGDRSAIIFAASVKQAETVSSILNRHKSQMSEWVCGMTNKDTRREINSAFESGKIQVLCNCGVYTEGYDNPRIEVVVMARPTKSRSLYAQMGGRGTRPLPGIVDHLTTGAERRAAIAASSKPSCLFVDFVGNSGRHKLVTSADILGGKVSDQAIAAAVAKARNSNQPVRITEELDKAQEEINEKIKEARLAEEARKAKLVAKVKFSARAVNPFDIFQIAPAQARGWDAGKVLSEKQKALLLRNGINPDTVSYPEGRQLVAEIFRRWDKKLATAKQLKTLARYGYNNPEMSYEDASKTLDAISKNGWRRV